MMKTFRLFIGLFIFIAAIGSNTFTQDVPNSVGPAPYVDSKAPVNNGFDSQIGTRAFTQISSSPTFQFGKTFMESCTITNIGAPFTITFPGGLVNKDGAIFTYNQSSPFQLWRIDTVTGTHTLQFNMTGVPQANFTGMVWDGTTLYGMSTSITQSQIFSINTTTGACTPIGSASSVCAGGITLLGRPGAQYSLFALDIVADNLYKINKTTGVFTLVGPLGANCNFGQDGCVDPNDNTFYAMAYTTAPQLRKVDTTTGALGPILCTYTNQATGLALMSSTVPPTVLNACRSGLNLPINDHSTLVDSVQVILGAGCNITDVNVRIDTVLHTWDGDMSFYLRKGTTGVKIINKVGGSGDNFIGTILDDQAATPIASGTAPFTGSFQPSFPLSVLNGPWTTGYWKLVVTDTASGDTGLLKAWCLVISYTCPTGGVQTVEIPNYYSLSQNYPNPFNPSTNIKFSLPQAENVKLVVFDLLGKEVATLVNEYKTSGIYEVSFDASSYASGVYFYSIQTPNFTQTKRMLLVK